MYANIARINEIGCCIISILRLLFVTIYDIFIKCLQSLPKYGHGFFKIESNSLDNLNYSSGNNTAIDIINNNDGDQEERENEYLYTYNVSGPSLSRIVLNNLLTNTDYYNSESLLAPYFINTNNSFSVSNVIDLSQIPRTVKLVSTGDISKTIVEPFILPHSVLYNSNSKRNRLKVNKPM